VITACSRPGPASAAGKPATGQDRRAPARGPPLPTPRPGVVTGLVDRPLALYGRGPAPDGPCSGLTGAAAHPLPAPLPDDADITESLTPDEQLRTVMARLSRAHELSVSAGTDYQPMGSVLLFRPWPARALHIVGQSPLAGEFRRLITSGAAPGWHLHPVPQCRTPLDVLGGPLLRRTGSRRFYNILDRHGFAYVEEVAATPDTCLLELRNSGPRMIAAVRAVISELGPADALTGTGGTADDARGPGRVPGGPPATLPPDAVAALQVVAAWGIAERGARALEDLFTLTPAAAGMPPDVARCWDRLAHLSLGPLAGPAAPDRNVTRLAGELLGQTDPRRRLVLTTRTFAPHRRTYDSLARELGISRERVRQLEADALTQLTRAAQHHRYAPLRWRAASTARPGTAVPAAAADTPPWMGKLMSWLASKTADTPQRR
jgi:sigma-70-like protein